MEVRIATFNIYWFPSSTFIGNQRSAQDREKIREVIRRLDADIIVFQEILDLEVLEEMLSNVMPGRSYSLRDQDGQWTSSSIGNGLKVPLAFDSLKLELLEVGSARNPGEPPANMGRRDAVAARLRLRGGEQTFTVIGVHLKSGILTVGPEPITADDFIRQDEMAKLTHWITTSAPIVPGGQERPAGEPTVLIGDFNAVRGNASLQPLTQDGDLSNWNWPNPRFASTMLPAPEEVPLPPSEQWTTHLDKKIIDHIILSPDVRLIDGPWAYAFDLDQSWLQAAGVSQAWLEQRDYTLTPGHGTPSRVENLHRITDHRPVRVSVEIV